MPSPSNPADALVRNRIAQRILVSPALATSVLAAVAIVADPGKNAMTIFISALPAFPSWVGTALAFYCGRESFESINATGDPVPVAGAAMEADCTCRDTVVPADGSDGKSPLDWISNVRLGRFLRPGAG